jgi:hypothetical protein
MTSASTRSSPRVGGRTIPLRMYQLLVAMMCKITLLQILSNSHLDGVMARNTAGNLNQPSSSYPSMYIRGTFVINLRFD